MDSQTSSSQSVSSDQSEFGESICERDNFTCQRCGAEEPDSGLAVARLDALDTEPDQETEADHRDPENHLALCRPCLALTRPDDEALDEYRSDASLYPADDADPRVAYVNSQKPYEPKSAFLDRILQGGLFSSLFGTSCARCNDEFDVEELVVFPAYKTVNPTNPGEHCEAVCRPCAGVILSARDTSLPAPILDHEGAVSDPAALEQRADGGKMTGPDGPLGEERDPVNRKEQFMQNRKVALLQKVWGIAVTLGVIIVLPFLIGRQLPAAIFSVLQTLPLLERHTDAAIYLSFVGAFFPVSIAATTVRWSLTWLCGLLWRIDPSVSAQHYRRQVFWRWRDVVQAWMIVYGILAALPVLVPLFMAYSFLTNETEISGRQQTAGHYGHDWSRTTGWWFIYK